MFGLSGQVGAIALVRCTKADRGHLRAGRRSFEYQFLAWMRACAAPSGANRPQVEPLRATPRLPDFASTKRHSPSSGCEVAHNERNPGGLACPPRGTAQGPFRGRVTESPSKSAIDLP